MKTAGQLLIFLGIITGIDSFGMLLPSPNVTSICATLLSVALVVVGAMLIRRSKPKS